MTTIKDKILGILAHPEEAKAFAEGKAIQFQNYEGNWYDIGSEVVNDDYFHVDSIYRIKPEVHTVIMWTNIYPHGPSFNYHSSKKIANEWANERRLACVAVPIPWTEGEGLDGYEGSTPRSCETCKFWNARTCYHRGNAIERESFICWEENV